MPRLRRIEREDAPQGTQEFYEQDEERYGCMLNNTQLAGRVRQGRLDVSGRMLYTILHP
jgi:hypothetical protein